MSRTKKFKMTDLGPIPEDWEVINLKTVCDTSSGGTPSRSVPEYFNGNVKWFTTSELEDCDLIDSQEHISERALQNSSAKIFPAGTLLMAMYGATIGKLGILKSDAATNQACCALFCKGCETKFLFYALLFNRESIIQLGMGAGQPNISQGIIRNLMFSFPSRPEQRHIAAALSDVDELIAALTELLEKKRNLKQGAMQQLLTGKRRLPGFKGKWVEKTLEDVAIFETKTVPSKSFNACDYVSTENMLQNKAGILPNREEIPYANVREYRVGDVLVSNIRPYLKKIWFATHDGGCSTDVHVVRVRSEAGCLPRYLNLILSQDSFFDFAMETATGTKMPRGDKRRIVTYSFRLPMLVDEQRAVAEVLTDMDEEIAGIEAELEKAKSVKTGMMQQLLTGKVRLEVA